MAGRMENNGGDASSRWRIARWGTALLVLLMTALAMQFTDEVNWDLADFTVFGAMLAGACGAYELAAMRTRNGAYRAAIGVALAVTFLVIWMGLAVAKAADRALS